METRKETLNALKLCRFCLTQDETLTSLYDRRRAPKNSVPLALKILSCVSIEVFPSDRMPSFICNRCKFFMDMSYEFKQLCRQADENVLEFIQTGSDLNSVSWPASLKKLYWAATKTVPEVAVMKTVVEGGATIQVTAHESDSDDDDENVYNVKIAGESDEDPKSARVKVVTADKQMKRKGKSSKDLEDHGSPTQFADETNIKPPAMEVWQQDQAVITLKQESQQSEKQRSGCWPCDECDCTYPLQQLLELHKKQKHRQRDVQCNQCDAKFFNNYDLATHQLRHSSEEMIFQCVACEKKFKRHILLKRHEKIMHANLTQLRCEFCPATFISQAELETHNEKHKAKEKHFVCDLCDKRFNEKSTLQRHKANVHDKEDSFACLYCPARFSSVSKLTRHVRTHAGDRSYPCKHCDKSFMKSHHYTRHLRLKHRETNRTCRGPFGESDYRCEQCEDTFTTQDELIYHSAIHATQNLTCPLCQEKFDDVDAVTVHIKSHVNGMEFMCDLCELVFTSKEKLDNHMVNAHDDEIQNEELGQEESSVEIDDDEDDTGINVKEEDDHMVVEIKKTDGFLLPNLQDDIEEKHEITNSEESESELYAELPTEDAIGTPKQEPMKVSSDKTPTVISNEAIITKQATTTAKTINKNDSEDNRILRRAEEIKRKTQPASEPIAEKKIKQESTGASNNTGASDKSLRLLEKELQELKRTNTRSEVVRTPAKPVDALRNRRPQVHTSTPKMRSAAVEERKTPTSTKPPPLEKKQPEKRIITKENKEPKDVIKDAKESNGNVKEDKEKEVKETTKNKIIQVKKNATEKTTPEEGIRRSTRPSKIKDYAKMIRDRTQDSDEDDDSDEVDEEYKEAEKNVENKTKLRKPSVKPSPKAAPGSAVTSVPIPTPRKRGRPRKDTAATPAKVKKDDSDGEAKPEENSEQNESVKKPEETENVKESTEAKSTSNNNINTENKTTSEPEHTSGVLVSPTGHTLKKIPVKALPPGITPIPLPRNSRPAMGTGELCKMQIGKKMVNVQKIVVTKAEVEAMAKRGLVQMKDGTMVLKQGIKIPSSDPAAIKTLVGDDVLQESPKKNKAVPTRCNIEDDV